MPKSLICFIEAVEDMGESLVDFEAPLPVSDEITDSKADEASEHNGGVVVGHHWGQGGQESLLRLCFKVMCRAQAG